MSDGFLGNLILDEVDNILLKENEVIKRHFLLFKRTVYCFVLLLVLNKADFPASIQSKQSAVTEIEI